MVRDSTKNVKYGICPFWYLSYNGTIANVVPYDLDIHFQGKKFVMLTLEMVRTVAKLWNMFIDFDKIAIEWPPLQILYSVTWNAGDH